MQLGRFEFRKRVMASCVLVHDADVGMLREPLPYFLMEGTAKKIFGEPSFFMIAGLAIVFVLRIVVKSLNELTKVCTASTYEILLANEVK